MTAVRHLILVLAAVLAAALLGAVVGPDPLRLDDPATGDAAFGRQVRDALGDRGHRTVAAALVDGDRVTYAGFGGADENTPFEIGSVTKVLTGMVLADLAADGVVRLDQPVGELAPGTPLAGEKATLRDLSTHRSGLPRIPRSPAHFARGALGGFTGGDPYTGTPADVLRTAGEAGAPGGAKPAYSNLGVATLGDALAVRTGEPYAALLTRRLLEPLGMSDTRVVTRTDALPAGRARGAAATNGKSRDPWIAEGYAPAGVGVWSTARDLALLARGVLAGTAPGVAAADPVADYRDGRRIGLGWLVSRIHDRTITWHNGATGGFTAYVGLDREAGRALVLLSASSEPVDDAGERLLTRDLPPRRPAPAETEEGR
jgi:CubicO group peptidase (beta-lactamase class C family)